ncbi:unnamed protein product [Tetraodon nigroviridis]|uniref:(spotted green pufferfish) hypothetical protein n=1 Tax=Tetraodon nigroviridis TaxID=99883 RepID=Q4S1P3_TETNG|nr:unnamed protein product [Tetraodon nigroviridis]
MFALLLYCFACCCSLSSFAFPIQDERNDRPIIGAVGPGAAFAQSGTVLLHRRLLREDPGEPDRRAIQGAVQLHQRNPLPRRGSRPGDVSVRPVRQNLLRPGYRGQRQRRLLSGVGHVPGLRGADLPDVVGELALVTQNDMRDAALPLNCYRSKESKMFRDLPAELRKALASESLTANSHKWSLATSSYDAHAALKKFYKVLSTNSDGDLEFVSTIEARDYPIYGTQWHPEKNAYEFTKAYVPHSPSAVRTSFYAAEFFVGEARKNRHGFGSEAEERKALIYNYSPEYGRPNGTFVQIYYF